MSIPGVTELLEAVKEAERLGKEYLPATRLPEPPKEDVSAYTKMMENL